MERLVGRVLWGELWDKRTKIEMYLSKKNSNANHAKFNFIVIISIVQKISSPGQVM